MHKPVLQSLVLADHVYKDCFTGKVVIAGTFNRIILTKTSEARIDPPVTEHEETEQQIGLRTMAFHEVCKAGSPFAYISLTDVRGNIPLELRYVDLADNIVLMRSEFTVTTGDPLETIEVVLQLPPLLAPHSGVYALELLTDNEPLGALRITAVEMTAQSRPSK